MPSLVQAGSTEEIAEALQALQNASKSPARQRAVKVSTHVNIICDHAFNSGLDSAELGTLLDLITRRTELDQTSITNLIKNLYPAQKVQNDHVTMVVGCLGQAKNKPTSVTQALLLKWLITIYEHLEDVNIVSKLYGVLFGLLDMISLRSYLCHLLALATKRKHVKPFRMQQLLELANSVGGEPALLGLTAVFKDFYPDIILSNAVVGRSKAFIHPNPEWRDRLHHIQQANLRIHNAVSNVQNGFQAVKHGTKRGKVGVIPQVRTLHAQESSVTLEEISGVDDFIENLERIQLPSQLIASLHDPLLQKYLSLRPSELSSQRIHSWLSNYVPEDSKLQAHASCIQAQEDMLTGILSFASTTQNLPPGAERLIKQLLVKWDGYTVYKPLSDCLILLPQNDAQDLMDTIVKPLEVQLLAGNSNPFLRILNFHTNLARRLLLLISVSDQETSYQHETHVNCFVRLANHVMDVILPILTMPPTSESIAATVIEFLEILVTPLRDFSTPALENIPIIMPVPRTFYLLLFDISPSNLSGLCSVLAAYKETLQKRRNSLNPPPQQIINQFNGYLMDVCNLLWRSRAFRKNDNIAMGCLLTDSLSQSLQTYLEVVDPEYNISYMFGLSHHSILSSLSITALREQEDLAETRGEDLRVRHAGPATQRSLVKLDKDGGAQIPWKEYRVRVLDFLEEHSLGGIKELMFSTMKDLFSKAV